MGRLRIFSNTEWKDWYVRAVIREGVGASQFRIGLDGLLLMMPFRRETYYACFGES